MKNILLASAALVSLMPALPALAQTCTAVPDCTVLGYTKTESQCSGRPSTRCPFDDTKYNCNAPTATECIAWGYTDSKTACYLDYVSCPGNSEYVRCVNSAAIGDLKYSWAYKDHNGWLLCDGRTITSTNYPALYQLVGAKLPNYTGYFLKGSATTTRPVKFRIVESAGLPNIAGTVNAMGAVAWQGAKGAFSLSSSKANAAQPKTDEAGYIQLDFDASKYSSIYGNSTTVTPPNYSANVFIYAGAPGSSTSACTSKGYWSSTSDGMTCTSVKVGTTTCYDCVSTTLQEQCRKDYPSTVFVSGTNNTKYYPTASCYTIGSSTDTNVPYVYYSASELSVECQSVKLIKSCAATSWGDEADYPG